MKSIIFSLPGNEHLSYSLRGLLNAENGEAIIRRFPDGESYIRIMSDIQDKNVLIVCTLDRPDNKLLPLHFLCKGLKEFGAKKITLISPYLAYMRQDKRFNPGEVITSEYFAGLISSFCDSLITIDPHLHRRNTMGEIYSIPCKVLHASEKISNWIKANIKAPLLIGPDSESEQWVSEVAKNANAPFIVLEKTRLGDNDVKITVPHVEQYKQHTPVLVDDIISTAKTMIETVNHLKNSGLGAPACIGVHPIFSGNAYHELVNSGVAQVVTCNTIEHISNEIDISDLLAEAIC